MTDLRLTLIKFVTTRQGELQGLRNAAFAVSALATLALITWLSRTLPDTTSMLGPLSVIAAWSVASTGSALWVERWYASRYGRVGSSRIGVNRSTMAQLLMGLGALVALAVVGFLDHRVLRASIAHLREPLKSSV